MRRLCVMAVCALGLMLVGAAESQAGCCLFGGLFHSSCYAPRPCCYSPPPCRPSPCYSNSCGYSSASYYAPSSCGGYGCSGCSSCGGSCYGGGCASGSCGSGCASGNCGVSYQPAPTATVYAPAPFFQARVAPIVRQPVVMTTPRPTSLTLKPVSIDRRQSQVNNQWQPVGVIR